MSEGLKVNTTLQSLDLWGVQKQQDKTKKEHEININDKAGIKISDEGGFALLEALKVNTTLTALKLRREHQQNNTQQKKRHQPQRQRKTTSSNLEYYFS